MPHQSSSPETELGFPALTHVATLRTIAHLFSGRRSRCGIYLLEFPDQRYYIGQAVDVVRRFAQHRRNYEEIVGFSFMETPRAQLDDKERELIHHAERLGLILFNTVHAANVVGETDLDLVVTPEEQTEFLDNPAAFNARDASAPIVWPAAVVERTAAKYRRFRQQPLADPAAENLAYYLARCVVAPRRTEYSFWAVSCLPGTNHHVAPRLLCVNAGVMELFVVGWDKGAPTSCWGFVNVASDVLLGRWQSRWRFRRTHPSIRLIERGYRDAGQFQILLHAYSKEALRSLLQDEMVQCAAAALSLRVMRKRATIYGKNHCKLLADAALGGGERVSTA